VAIIEVHCAGVKWQDDFVPLVRRLYTYFSCCFSGERDFEEKRHKAVLRFMHRFMRAWERGKLVRIGTRYIVWHARAGRDVLPLTDRHHKSVANTVRLTPRVLRRAGRRIDVATELDLKHLLERLPETERAILEDLRARYCWREIRERRNVSDHRIKKTLRKARRLLSR
jgi:hypothetical protein